MKIPSIINDRSFPRILLAIFVVGILSLFITPLFRISFPESGFNFLGKDSHIELDPGKNITQIFKARRNGLDQIYIVINQLGSLGPKDSVTLTLLEKNCETPIATESISDHTPSYFIYYHFRFDRISDSAEHIYCLKISSTALKREKNRPYLLANEGASFVDTGYFNNADNKFTKGYSLEMRPAYSNDSLIDNLRELENRLSQYKPLVFKGHVLILGFTTLLFTIILTAALIVRRDED